MNHIDMNVVFGIDYPFCPFCGNRIDDNKSCTITNCINNKYEEETRKVDHRLVELGISTYSCNPYGSAMSSLLHINWSKRNM
mgnify:CR=1 FL=1